MSHDIRRALRRAVRALGKSVRTDAQQHGLALHPYRGYGSSEQIFAIGRVLRQSNMRHTRRAKGGFGYDLLAAVRHFTRRGVAGVRLAARFYGNETHTSTDRDGYFRVQMAPGSAPAADRLWHMLELEVLEPKIDLKCQAEVFIPSDSARFVVVSDIDDTVMYTGVANRFMMLWRMFVQDAASRVAFPGVAAFYRALHQGVSGDETNPVLFVSRGPWSLYEMLDTFFNIHNIPAGPLLFLREWGLTLQRPLPRRAKEHKLELIRGILTLYKDLPCVLIGDSGQHDPETYTRILQEYPGKVRAIYIRAISRATRRTHEIEALAQQVAAAGSTLVLASDSFSMAEHAATLDLIAPAAVAEIAKERRAQGEAPPQSAPEVHGSLTKLPKTHAKQREIGAEPGAEYDGR
ncbi:MAG: DUF2183 domain-containing protein [Nitrococcus mobilis]|nr:DUF2183 domain-containing protein [Nitrococcus mobilis]